MDKEDSYLGQERTPRSESVDSGGFLTILIPNFSISVVDAIILKFVRRQAQA